MIGSTKAVSPRKAKYSSWLSTAGSKADFAAVYSSIGVQDIGTRLRLYCTTRHFVSPCEAVIGSQCEAIALGIEIS